MTDTFATPDDLGELRASELHSSLGEQLGARAGETFMGGARTWFRNTEYGMAKGAPPPIDDPTGAYLYQQQQAELPPVPDVSIDDAKARVKQEGLEGQLHLPDQPTIRQPVLDLMIDHAHERRQYDAAVARGPQGFFPGALGFMTEVGAGIIDPVNLAAFSIPIAGEARMGKIMMAAGDSVLARTGVRLATGAAQGAIGTAGLQPAEWWLHTQDGQDYTFADALRSVVLGAGMGAAFHAGFGGAGDVLARARGRPLPGSPEEALARGLILDARARRSGSPTPEISGEEVPGITEPPPAGARLEDVARELQGAQPPPEAPPGAAPEVAPVAPRATGYTLGKLSEAPPRADPLTPAERLEFDRLRDMSERGDDMGDEARDRLDALWAKDGDFTRLGEWLRLVATHFIRDPQGNEVGSLFASYDATAKHLHVGDISADRPLGLSVVRDLMRQLRQEFPEAETIGGNRITGARGKAGAQRDVTVPLPLAHPAAILSDLPARVREDAVRSAIADMVQGNTVRGAELIDEAAKEEPRIAETLGNVAAATDTVEGRIAQLRELAAGEGDHAAGQFLRDRADALEAWANGYHEAEPHPLDHDVMGLRPPLEPAVPRGPNIGAENAALFGAYLRGKEALPKGRGRVGFEGVDLLHPTEQKYRTSLERFAPKERADARAIFQDLIDQYRRAGLPYEEAEHTAAIVAARYVTRAQRLGGKSTPLELYTREGIHLRRGDLEEFAPEGQSFDQGWPEADVARLKELHGRGLSYAEIAAEMGKSRSTIAGKLDRLGLGGGDVQAVRAKPGPWGSRPARGPRLPRETAGWKAAPRPRSEAKPSGPRSIEGRGEEERAELDPEAERIHRLLAAERSYRPAAAPTLPTIRAMSRSVEEVEHEAMARGAAEPVGDRFWPRERTAKLHELAADPALTWGQIAERLGVTRAAVIEKARQQELLGRKPGTPFGQIDDDELLRMRRAGVSMRNIGAEMGVGAPRIMERLKQLGEYRPSPWSDQTNVAWFDALAAQGWSRSQIAKEMGLTVGQIEGRFVALRVKAARALSQDGRGRITFAEGSAIVQIFAAGDRSTFMHEMGHLWLDELVRDAAAAPEGHQLKADLATVLKWLGVDRPEDIATKQHEQWAQGFEQYLSEGRAPSTALRNAFRTFAEWLRRIYRSLTDLGAPVSNDIRGVMDRLIESDKEIASRDAHEARARLDAEVRARTPPPSTILPPPAAQQGAPPGGQPQDQAVRTGRPEVDAVLADPIVAEAIAHPKIDRSHDVPYEAGASEGADTTTHLDRRLPQVAELRDGRSFDPAIPANIHEQVEKRAMELMIAHLREREGREPTAPEMERIYETAHHEYAEPAEDAWYRTQGLDIDEVNAWWARQDKITEHEHPTNPPPDLYRKPYPHNEVEGVRHEASGSAAEWPTTTPVENVKGQVGTSADGAAPADTGRAPGGRGSGLAPAEGAAGAERLRTPDASTAAAAPRGNVQRRAADWQRLADAKRPPDEDLAAASRQVEKTPEPASIDTAKAPTAAEAAAAEADKLLADLLPRLSESERQVFEDRLGELANERAAREQLVRDGAACLLEAVA